MVSRTVPNQYHICRVVVVAVVVVVVSDNVIVFTFIRSNNV